MSTGPSVNSPWSGAGHQGGHTHLVQGGDGQSGGGATYSQGGSGGSQPGGGGKRNAPDYKQKGHDRAGAQTGQKFRVLKPEWYGKEGGRNQHMPGNLKELFEPIQKVTNWKHMFLCWESSFTNLARWKGYDYGICPRFLCGYYPFQNYDAAHLYTMELPENCSRSVHKVMRKGVSQASMESMHPARVMEAMMY